MEMKTFPQKVHFLIHCYTLTHIIADHMNYG